MSLWVRSQNKKELIECDNFSLNSPGEAYVNNVNNARIITNYEIVCYPFENSHCILGTYSTKEKALKVLDMIQNAILIDYIVFQMPQDNEVLECQKD